jgi:hypothetical protein
MENKIEILRPPCFEKGDIIVNYKMTDIRLILSITEDGRYEYIQVDNNNVYSLHGEIIKSKGSICKQPIEIVEKYFCLYKIE